MTFVLVSQFHVLNVKVLVGAFNQVSNRGPVRDCENRWIVCSSSCWLLQSVVRRVSAFPPAARVMTRPGQLPSCRHTVMQLCHVMSCHNTHITAIIQWACHDNIMHTVMSLYVPPQQQQQAWSEAARRGFKCSIKANTKQRTPRSLTW